ncbi:hypothetical protein L4D06_03010 [Enterovibrio makurazakiensis]|uniref:hypothetical protein n=1 Tax=Enterovibrio makurazakiensis TaxID=2910232 RepID=UPI003D23B54D
MKKALITLAAILAISALSGCAARVAKNFDDKGLPLENYAIVKGVEDDFYSVFFLEYAALGQGADKKPKKVGDAFIGYPGALHLLPGNYYINVECNAYTGMGTVSAWLSARMKLEAGNTYELECNDVGENKIRLDLDSQYESIAN